MEGLPSNPVQADISPINVSSSSTATASTKKVGRPELQLTPKTKQKRRKQQQREAGKKCRAAKNAKVNSIPALEKTIFDNLLQHQKEKDALGSEISELKDTLSVTAETLKKSNNQSRRG